MTLTAPAWLAAAALALLILALHMRRRRHLEIPSIVIWRMLDLSGTPNRSVRRPPLSAILILQLLIAILAALALAQPFLGGGGDAGHRIYVLDASGSMRATDVAPSRFDVALAELRTAIERSPGTDDDRVSVIVAGATAGIVVARQTDPDGMLPLLGGVAAGDGTADWAGAAALAAAVAVDGETTTLVVLSDDADAGAGILDTAIPGATLEHHRTATDGEPGNAAIAATVTPLTEQGAEAPTANAWTIAGTVTFTAAAPEVTPIRILYRPVGSSEFLVWAEYSVRAPALPAVEEGAEPPPSLRFRAFDTEVTLPGPGTLRLELPADAGPSDDGVQFVLRDTTRLARVLYLGDGNPPLLRALEATGVAEVFTASTVATGDTEFDLVIVDGIAIPAVPPTNVLWLGTASLTAEGRPSALADAYPTGWDADHPLSAAIDWSTVTPGRAYAVPVLPGAEVLLETARSPLIQARTTPSGREIVVAFDVEGSDWVDATSFPVFVANLLGWLNAGFGSAVDPACTVGLPCPVEARSLSLPIAAEDGAVVWTPPAAVDGWLLAGSDATFVPAQAGFYRIGGSADARLIAVNPPAAAEVSLAPRADAPASDAWSFAGGPLPLWWWVVLAVLLLLLAEAWLAGRGSEQFLRATGLSRANPLARRRRTLLGLRIATVAFVVLALAGVPILWPRDNADLVIIAAAQSVSGAPAADEFAVDPSARTATVALGPSTSVTADLGADPAPAGSAEVPQGANLEQALAIAAAMVPAGRDGRILLAGDGNETEGSVVRAIPAVAGRGIAVDVGPGFDLPAGEVLVTGVALPSRLFAGEAFTLEGLVYAQASASAEVTIRRDGETVATQPVELFAGLNRVEVDLTAGDAGAVLYEVAVATPGDTVAINNRSGTVAEIHPTPSILVMTPEQNWGEFFADALRVQGLEATVMQPSLASWTLDGWVRYDVIVFMNMPALDLDTRQQELVRTAVEVHGTGLLILGGENSFGPGGYFETPLEDLSPLSARVPQESPQAAIAFVLDRSGSMQARVGEVNRLDIAKAATLTALELLHPETQFTIVLFDENPYVVVPMRRGIDLAEVGALLGPIEPGGGTSILPGMQAAFEQLLAADTDARHMIVMTDGLSEPGDFATLEAQMREEGITVSTVAIGQGADTLRLENIARAGGGAFHATQDFQALPSILSQEALLMGGIPVEEGETEVVVRDVTAPYLAGLPDPLPPVLAYVRTTAKAEADLHLVVFDEEDEEVPLLASWRYGNGQVLAFATHGAGPGTARWMADPEYPLFWAQIVRDFVRDTLGPGLHLDAFPRGDAVAVTAALLDEDGAPVSGAAVYAVIADAAAIAAEAAAEPAPAPAGDAPAALPAIDDAAAAADAALPPRTPAAPAAPVIPAGAVLLTETVPGQYEATLSTDASGIHRVTVIADDLVATAAVDLAYPARFDFSRANPEALLAVAAATGGSVLSPGDTVATADAEWTAVNAWRLWLGIALLLLMVDLTLRHAPGLLRLRRRTPAMPRGAMAVPAE